MSKYDYDTAKKDPGLQESTYTLKGILVIHKLSPVVPLGSVGSLYHSKIPLFIEFDSGQVHLMFDAENCEACMDK